MSISEDEARNMLVGFLGEFDDDATLPDLVVKVIDRCHQAEKRRDAAEAQVNAMSTWAWTAKTSAREVLDIIETRLALPDPEDVPPGREPRPW